MNEKEGARSNLDVDALRASGGWPRSQMKQPRVPQVSLLRPGSSQRHESRINSRTIEFPHHQRLLSKHQRLSLPDLQQGGPVLKQSLSAPISVPKPSTQPDQTEPHSSPSYEIQPLFNAIQNPSFAIQQISIKIQQDPDFLKLEIRISTPLPLPMRRVPHPSRIGVATRLI
jgi:hypothetical protein